MATLLDDRQVVNRSALSAIGSSANATLDTIFPLINTFFANATAAATASVLMKRDANANTSVNNLIESATSIATAAGTTTLTVASTYFQQFTGSTTQTVVLPDATTLAVGQSFYITNRSTGYVTVNKNGGSLLQSLAPNSQATVTVTNIGTSAGTWDVSYSVSGPIPFLQTTVNTDSTTTGSAATLTAADILAGVVRLTNGSLISVSGIPAGTSGQQITIENQTGNSILINNNDAGATAANRIFTGTGALVSMSSNATFTFVYDTTASRWMLIGGTGSGSGSGGKNYLGTVNNINGNGDFELASTSKWSLQHSTLDSNTKIPNQASGSWTAASGNLAISAISSGQLAGSYSLSYASSAADVAGDMVVSDAFTLDSEDQMKVFGYKFSFKMNSGAANGNFSGTNLNSFAMAVYDVTNAVWLQNVSNQYGVIQQNGTTFVVGSFQTSSNGTQYRFAFYNMNATTGATTVYLDDFQVGPVVGAASGFVNPTVQTFTSGSGTYITPTNPRPAYIKVRMVGGGGGGSGAGTTGAGNGSAGSATTFGTSLLSAGGGSGATAVSLGGDGGTSSLGSGPIGVAVTGSKGNGSQQGTTGTSYPSGGSGGNSPYFSGGGATAGSTANNAQSGIANSGGGGAGGSATSSLSANNTGSGGGSGGFVEAIINNPASSYSYAVGSGGSGGGAGTGGGAGASGGSGQIIVEEFYSPAFSGSFAGSNGTYASNAPTVQKFLSGSGTYITPTNPVPLYIEVEMVGGGGGGGGGGASATPGSAGGTGGNSTFGSSLLTANGGTGGQASGAGTQPGGTATISAPAIGAAFQGGPGGSLAFEAMTSGNASAGNGASTPFGGGGTGGNAGSGPGASSPSTNTGAGGGGGAASTSALAYAAGGGGAGGYIKAIINNPASSYSYAVGAAGTAGGAGASGSGGAAGAAGIIIVREFYAVGGAAANSAAASNAVKYVPTVQKFLSGSGTYITPVAPIPLYIKVRMVGGGGGSSGSGTAAGTGSNGTASTFGSSLLTANPGSGGSGAGGGGGNGGTATVSAPAIQVVAVTGGSGSQPGNPNGASGEVIGGGAGGNSAFGGANGATNGGTAAASNTGSGGGGGTSGGTATSNAGSGGGAGGYLEAIIPNPASSYSYAVGTGGNGGSGGTSNAGGSGVIIVEEYYQ